MPSPRRRSLLTATALCCGVLVSGCGNGRTVLVEEGSPIRAGRDVEGHVYTMQEGVWTISNNTVKVPEGWYIVPPSFAKE